MKCPKCNALMHRVGFEQVVREEVFETWQCPACGYRIERRREKPKPEFPTP